MLEIKLKNLVTNSLEQDGLKGLLDKAIVQGFTLVQLDDARIYNYINIQYRSPIILLENPAKERAVISCRDGVYWLDICESVSPCSS